MPDIKHKCNFTLIIPRIFNHPTEIIDDEGELRIEDLIADEDVAITVSNTGYVKRTAVTQYRNQRRGGKGRIGMRTREEDFLTHVFIASTHAYILIFSDRGRVYWLKVHEIPDVGPAGRGKAIANLVAMEDGERIAALEAVKEWPSNDGEKFVVMGTRKGVVKRTDLRAFRRPRAGGIIAMGVGSDDAVVGAELTDGRGDIFIGTRKGMAIRFKETGVRPMGRTAYGVRGVSLRSGDEVVSMTAVRPGGTLLTVTAKGYGKQTAVEQYRVQSRGGVGIINIHTSKRNGEVAGVAFLDAPVSGGEPGAIAGTLAIMVGGKQDVFDTQLELLESMGGSIVLCGDYGAGNTTKLANQIIVAANIEAVGEAFTLAKKAGLDPNIVFEAIKGGLAGSTVLNAKGPMMMSGDFAPGFRINLHRKDLNNALITGQQLGVSLPVTALVQQMIVSLVNSGEGDSDHSAIANFLEDMAGITISGK